MASIYRKSQIPVHLLEFFEPAEIGLESSPDEYVARMVAVFREVRRTLRDDGTLWLNLGDSYSGYHGNSKVADVDAPSNKHGYIENMRTSTVGISGLKPKDLCMIPWRVALALQADGWWLRSVIVWAKKSPMPESVTDRPTSSWEPIFLLAKSSSYYYDADAVKEPVSVTQVGRVRCDAVGGVSHKERGQHSAGGVYQTGPRFGGNKYGDSDDPAFATKSGNEYQNTGSRNQRNVWHLGPEPYAQAHFATFPSEIPRRAILAGTSEKGCCPECGAPWERVIENTGRMIKQQNGGPGTITAHVEANGPHGATSSLNTGLSPEKRTSGWKPGCGCGSGLSADDLEIIETPTGKRIGDDPSLTTGRAGMNRPRGDEEGSSPTTRYEQRQYAAQIKVSSHKAAMATEAGPAFAHYIRTDRSGARPVPPALLGLWIRRGWLVRVEIPTNSPLAPVPCVVLDPFLGSGTTLAVAAQLGRNGVGCELNPEYVKLAQDRIGRATRPNTYQSDKAVDAPLFGV